MAGRRRPDHVEYALLLLLVVIVGVDARQALGHTVGTQAPSVTHTIEAMIASAT